MESKTRTVTYGCRKCSNSHVLSTATAWSGSPLWDRQRGCWRKVTFWTGFWLLIPWSDVQRLGTLLSLPTTALSAVLSVNRIWFRMALFKQLKCFAMALKAKHTYGAAFPRPETHLNDATTDCICWQYSLYFLYTWWRRRKSKLEHVNLLKYQWFLNHIKQFCLTIILEPVTVVKHQLQLLSIDSRENES